MFGFSPTEILHKVFPPRYMFLMIDNRSEVVHLSRGFYTKIHALHCLDWHTRFSHLFKYRVYDAKKNKEISF